MATGPRQPSATPQGVDTSRAWPESWLIRRCGPSWIAPPDVEGRLIPGHWEGDLIKGAGNRSSVGTLVERTTGFVVLAKMSSARAADALERFSQALERIPASLRKTLTYDQGREMSYHTALTLRTGVEAFFADPHSPWQRGSNENTNGLLRQYLPKGTNLAEYSQD